MPRPEVFLSYARADKEIVEKIAQKLHQRDIPIWLDEWKLIPGEPWMGHLAQALRDCSRCLVFFGPGGLGQWQNEEFETAIDRAVKDKSFLLIPVLLPGAKREDLKFLANRTWVDFSKGLDDSNALHRLVSGIRRVEPGPPAIVPRAAGRRAAARSAWMVLLIALVATVYTKPQLLAFLYKERDKRLDRSPPQGTTSLVAPSRPPEPKALSSVRPPSDDPPARTVLDFRTMSGAVAQVDRQVETVNLMPPGTYGYVHARQMGALDRAVLLADRNDQTYEIQRAAKGNFTLLGFVSEKEHYAMGLGGGVTIPIRPAPSRLRWVLVAVPLDRITRAAPKQDGDGPFISLTLTPWEKRGAE